MARTKALFAGLLLALVALVCSAVPLTCAHADDVDEGYYQIKVNEDQSKALGFTSGYVAGGDRVILQRANDEEPGQVFYLKKVSAGIYEVRVGYDQDLTLDVVNSNYANGTQLCAWKPTGGKNQRFFVQRNSNGSYTFACQGNISFGIDDSGGGHKLGNKATIYSRGTTGLGSSNKNQQFALVPAKLPGLTHTEACKGDTITYRVSQRVNTWGVDAFVRYESFTLSDQLPEGLEFLSADVKQDDGTSVAGYCEGGKVAYDSKTRTVKADLKRSFLQDSMLFPLDGQTYVLEIRARIAEIPKSEQLENVGNSEINDNSQTSNKVVTQVLEPKLEQTKEVHTKDGNDEKDGQGRLLVKVDDTVHYVIQARQTRQGAVQWPTELTDEIPDGLKLDESSVKLEGPSGASVTTSGNTITMHTGRLPYDQPVRIEYDCKVLDSVCGEEVVNVFGEKPPVKVPGLVHYRRDGENVDVYTDIVNEKHGKNPRKVYQLDNRADKVATRSNCSGIIGWYLDPECAIPYDPSKNGKIPAKDGEIYLYTKNKVTLSYGMTNDSFPKRFPNKKYYSDEQMTKGVTTTSVLPASETHYYGDVVSFAKGPDIWYRSMGARQLRCSEGAYAYANGSGDLLTEARLTGNSTAWLKWGGGTYDGIWTR